MPSLTVSDYSNTHEIRELRYDVGASGIDSQNRLYFGGSRGFLRFRPSDIEQNTFVPKMVVSSISIGDRMYEEKFLLGQLDTLEVRSTDYWFSIDYNVIDYFNNTLHSYRHKLTNFDRDWVRTGSNGSATYTNLPPGEYFFHAQGTDSSGNTNTDGIQLKIVVYPPPGEHGGHTRSMRYALPPYSGRPGGGTTPSVSRNRRWPMPET